MGIFDWLFGAKPQQAARAAPPQSASPPAVKQFVQTGAPPEVAQWVAEARRARAAGDTASARMCYQKAAYGFAQLSKLQNEQLKHEIADFVRTDPFYADGFAVVRATVQATPGLLQSDLGKAAGENRDALNYILYYAAMVGDLVRVKAGRSYRLYLRGQPIPPEPVKSKRPRKTS